MTASYPGAYATFASHGATMNVAPTHDSAHVKLEEEQAAVQATLGLSPQGSDGTVRARLDRMDRRTGIQATVASMPVLTTATTAVVWTTELFDTDGFLPGSGSTFTVPAGRAGIYTMTARANAGTGVSATSAIIIKINGTRVGVGYLPAGNADMSVTVIDRLSVSDLVTVEVFNGHSGNLNFACVATLVMTSP